MTESQQQQAWVTSLRLLAATPKTRKELAKKLLDKGYPESVVEGTLEKLETQGLLSDLAYAKNLAVKLTQGKPSGRRKISFEMKRHGVPAKIQEEVLSGITADDETERAFEIAAPKWRTFQRLPEEKRKKRLFDFLMRRGFDYQIVREVMNRLKIDEDEN
jgi:regulatory protein